MAQHMWVGILQFLSATIFFYYTFHKTVGYSTTGSQCWKVDFINVFCTWSMFIRADALWKTRDICWRLDHVQCMMYLTLRKDSICSLLVPWIRNVTHNTSSTHPCVMIVCCLWFLSVPWCLFQTLLIPTSMWFLDFNWCHALELKVQQWKCTIACFSYTLLYLNICDLYYTFSLTACVYHLYHVIQKAPFVSQPVRWKRLCTLIYNTSVKF